MGLCESSDAVDTPVSLSEMKGRLSVNDKNASNIFAQIMEIKNKQKDNCMAQAFDKKYYDSLSKADKLRLLTCCLSGVANPESCMGCYAMSPSDYDDFKPFFDKALSQYHKVDLKQTSHKNSWSLDGVDGLPASGILDLLEIGVGELPMRVRTGRNLKKFPLPGAMTKQQRIDLEKEMKKVFDVLIADSDFGGRYVSITPNHENFVAKEEYDDLVKNHIMFKDMSNDSYLVQAGIA